MNNPSAVWPRIADLMMGLSVLSWAIAGAPGWGSSEPWPIRAGTVGLNSAVGLAFLVRSRVTTVPSGWAVVASAPSLLLGGACSRLAAGHWTVGTLSLFGVGVLMVMAGLGSLGRSFAVFAVSRPVVVRGVYRYIRHPIYLGELLICLSAAVARPWPGGVLLLVVGWSLRARMAIEEAALMKSGDYASYAQRVRYRWLPGVY